MWTICSRPAGISIHAPHEGERQKRLSELSQAYGISIHAPHEGERRFYPHRQYHDKNFNPRSPRGGATIAKGADLQIISISIHAPHEGERLLRLPRVSQLFCHFNPRSPRGGATSSASALMLSPPRFQSTLPTRGSDFATNDKDAYKALISIHAPHEGERPICRATSASLGRISIHAPHEGERPYFPLTQKGSHAISIHAPHEGERLMINAIAHTNKDFNPRSPRGGATDIMA